MKVDPAHFLVFAAIVAISLLIFLPKESASAGNFDPAVKLKFDLITNSMNVACFGPSAILSMSDSGRLIGSCCGPMFLHKYAEQIEGLKKYSNIEEIPIDPYDIEVSQAKELLSYLDSITLTSEEQSIYDEAMNMSDEGGPCCCKCWRWYVYEGLAKFLIRNYKFDSHQIAEVWDLSEGCGGDEHTEMH